MERLEAKQIHGHTYYYGPSGNFVANRRHPTTEFASVKECPQLASFAGQRPSHLPSPGQRPGSQGDHSPKGPTARPFATDSMKDKVDEYIRSQEQHHATSSFQDEYRRLCEKHGIEIDERYVWD